MKDERATEKKEAQSLLFSNKLQKLVSVSAGLASSTFSIALFNQLTQQVLRSHQFPSKIL